MRLGTGGAIKNALSKLSDNFFILYGDSYLQIELEGPYLMHQKNLNKNILTVIKNENRWDSSNIRLEDHVIVEYSKAKMPFMDYIDYGLSIFSKDAFTNYDHIFDLGDLYQQEVRKRSLQAYIATDRFYEIGSLQGIKDFNEYIFEKRGLNE